MKDFATGKTPRFKRKDGRFEVSGNLAITSVAAGEKGDVIHCHACYIGEFDLRRVRALPENSRSS